MDRETAEAALGRTYAGLPDAVFGGRPVYRGKVRDVVQGTGRLLLVASDRISAYDRILSTIPFKGEVITRIAAYWFRLTSDIAPNHVIPTSALGGRDPVAETGRACLALRAKVVPVEVVVRGFLTGSAWRDYESGRPISGILLPQGLQPGAEFPEPLLTPSTKEPAGHDVPLSGDEIVRSGRVDSDLWEEISRTARALYIRGREVASERGLILVDTKYEFGVVDGRLILVDEIHTPDSSRYWRISRDGVPGRGVKGGGAVSGTPAELDKEGFRRWLAGKGYTGDGEPPAIPEDLRVETALRYVEAFETITGEVFEPSPLAAQALDEILAEWARAV